jgi:hypothetical protein
VLLSFLRHALLIAGAGTLAYPGVLSAEAYFTQRYETLRFDTKHSTFQPVF